MEAESLAAVVETPTSERIREVVAEEREIIEEAPRVLRETPIKQPVIYRDDDWFILLDAGARETSYVPPGII